MTVDVGDWVDVRDSLPDFLAPVYAACRVNDGSRENWTATGIIYGIRCGTKNDWGLPILDFNDQAEVYAWMPEWYPEPPKESEIKR